MKRQLRIIGSFLWNCIECIGLLAASYLILSFVNFTFDVSIWSSFTRFLFGFIGVICLIKLFD